jgi:glycine cleavage system regulatory protein
MLFRSSANILETRMSNLRGIFVVMILLEISPDSAADLSQHANALAHAAGLNLNLHPHPDPDTGAAAPSASHANSPALAYRLQTYSIDQPGIVARFGEILQRHSVNIEDLAADQRSAPFAGHPLFVTDFRLRIPAHASVQNIRADLHKLAGDLNCDLDFEPIK